MLLLRGGWGRVAFLTVATIYHVCCLGLNFLRSFLSSLAQLSFSPTEVFQYYFGDLPSDFTLTDVVMARTKN